MESPLFGKALLVLSGLGLAAFPVAAVASGLDSAPQHSVSQGTAQPATTPTGGQSYGDRNRGGPYGFYSYPRHRHIDGAVADRGMTLDVGDVAHSYADRNQGSAYYGRDYGAPYHGGGYYDGGTYFRERRD